METIKFIKVRNVKSPERAHWQDAGIDFFVPNDFILPITLYPNERVSIPSGVKAEIPFGYALIAFNKTGISSKYGLDKIAEVVDYGYQGEIHISIVNTSNEPVNIYSGQKIIQFILVQIGMHTPIEVLEEDIFKTKSARGEGCFGSTGEY